MKGFQVAPAELEALLLTNDDIADVAVVGVALYVHVPRSSAGAYQLICLGTTKNALGHMCAYSSMQRGKEAPMTFKRG